MLERDIERKVCQYAKSKGWIHFKFVSPGNNGVPDRILMRDGKVIFIEFKATGERPTVLQAAQHRRLRASGMMVHVIDSIAGGEKLMDTYETLT